MSGIVGDFTATPGVLQDDLASVALALEWVSAAIDMISIAIMLIGAVRFVLSFVTAETRRDDALRVQGIDRGRMELGRYILAGLELFIVSDIIHTVLSLALNDLLFLGLLVLIRSAISFFLDREIQQISQELGR